MSTIIMAAYWPLQMPPTAKTVLISLADNANDAGYCWPSIATICTRTCLGKTAVIEAIKFLEAGGFLVANRDNGRHTRYTVLPGTRADDLLLRTGAAHTPVRQTNRSATQTGSGEESGGNLFASQTGPADEPVRDAEDTGPSGGPHRSVSRTAPVRQADTNRQEPSITVIDPPHAREEEEQLPPHVIDELLMPYADIPPGVSRNTLARFIRHRATSRRHVSVQGWFELRARLLHLAADGHDLNLSLRQTMEAGLMRPVVPTPEGAAHATTSTDAHRSHAAARRESATERAARINREHDERERSR